MKRDNLPAIRLYRHCGFEEECEVWVLRLPWNRVGALTGAIGCAAFTPTAEDDAAIGAKLAVDPERLALVRAQGVAVLLALREDSEPVAFAAFIPAHPLAYPFRVARSDFLAGRCSRR